MPETRGNRYAIWIVLLLLLITAAAAGVYMGLRPKPTRVVQTPPPTTAEPSQADYDAATSWKQFVDAARAKCKTQEADCSVDYTALHDHAGGQYGVIIVGYKDSEYVTDLYRYDPQAKSWVSAPRHRPDDGYEVIDTQAASEMWGVPKDVLDNWITSAEKAVSRVYERRSQGQE